MGALFFTSPASAQTAPVTFQKNFSPAVIGPGSTTRLRLVIDNTQGATPLADLAFSDTLPAGMTIAAAPVATSSCGGTLSAPAGGSTITLSDGTLGASATCVILVNVTSSTPGFATNTTTDLTSDHGNHGTATADLDVDPDLAGFSKSFAPSTVNYGDRSTLTFTVDNTLNNSAVVNANFVDVLPPGMVIASPNNLVHNCDVAAPVLTPTITAPAGGNQVTLSFSGTLAFPFVVAGSTCQLSVDVVALTTGTLENVSGDFLHDFVSTGTASATLVANGQALTVRESFLADPVAPGETIELQFDLSNQDRASTATDITFTNDLDASLSGLAISGALPADPCGAGSTLTGTSVLTLSNATLPPGGSCQFSVTLQVPAGATPGAYPNATTDLNAILGGMAFNGPGASDTLFVNAVPQMTKTFLTSPVAPGDDAVMEFVITNPSQASAATDVEFVDSISDFLGFGIPLTLSLPADDFCGAGSQASAVFLDTDNFGFSVTGVTLPAGGDCTFEVTVTIPAETTGGTYTNTTTDVTGIIDGTAQTGPAASADLEVLFTPQLVKSFSQPAVPGGAVDLEFVLSLPPEAPGPVTDITFTDDLGAALTGLVATGLPLADACGTGASLAGTDTLTLTGATLTPGGSCTMTVALQVPAGATPGSYTNTTSTVSATSQGVSVNGPAATADLEVVTLRLSKEFTDDPVIPGATATLRFTLENAGQVTLTNIFFSDDLNATLAGLAAAGLPMNDICGTGSSISGTTTLIFTSGTLAAGDSCTFDVQLQVPANAADGVYPNRTSQVQSSEGPAIYVSPGAADDLTVAGSVILLTKSFTDDPVGPGDAVTLEFTLQNLNAGADITDMTFTDDLDAALTGLVATSLPAADFCGAGSTISGTNLLTISGASLATGQSCTFSATLQVPAQAMPGTPVTNTTSAVTGMVSGLPVTGSPASDDLLILSQRLSKAFSATVAAGGTVDLEFTIDNDDGANSATALAFTDDLDAVLTGLVATGLPMNDVCGAGSVISGTGFLTLSGAMLPPGGSCSFSVSLAIPAMAAAGTYDNTTSALTSGGLTAGEPATAQLVIEPPPAFTKSFSPDTVGEGIASTMTLLIDNAASALDGTALALTDNLPSGMTIAGTPNASNTCGGTLTATAGATSLSLSGGAIAAGEGCIVTVDVTASPAGAFTNTTGTLTSSLGDSGTASATLNVLPAPMFSKAFAPVEIQAQGLSTLTLTIDNSASTITATGLDFTDTFPAGLEVASPANASTTCTGGTLTAVAGASSVSYTGASVSAGATCAISVDTTAAATGDYDNVSGNLVSSLGDSGTAAATLSVVPEPAFTKSFSPAAITAGELSTLVLLIDNSAGPLPAQAIDFTDNLPAGVTIASPANASTSCTGGTLVAADGGSTISYSGGEVGALSQCQVQVDTTSVTMGDHVNITGAMTSSLGDSGTATATLTVSLLAPAFSKAFNPAVIPAGGDSTLMLTIDNSAGAGAVNGLAFTDTFPAGLSIAATPAAGTDCGAGTVTAVAGSNSVSLSGGTVAANSSCTVTVNVTAPAAGSFTNTSGELLSDAGTSGTATATLDVVAASGLTRQFAGPVLPGGQVALRYTLSNPGAVPVTDITFSDDLDGMLPGLAAVAGPAADACGPGSQVTTGGNVVLTAGSLPGNGSCTFTLTVTVPADAPLGSHPGSTSPVSYMAGGSGFTAPAATSSLEVVYLDFTKSFPGGDVAPGDPVLLTFSITNPDGSNAATGLAFTDDIDSFVPGAVATGLPMSDVCGAGSTLSGTDIISLADGVLAPNSSCQFSVTLALPTPLAGGRYVNLTSPLGADVGGAPVSAPAGSTATAALVVMPAAPAAPAIPVPSLPWRGTAILALLVAILGFGAMRRSRLAY
ncbi:beta strand repeat-containing protein [Marinihelvus fidelis]|uniref:beta strand repeat-containing protein n=1 Tax=Marinihelvus fidelis TaxID=2613842 RepID=UPI00177EAD8B|nr:DUF11 domain-containing protein [Marinihelvus fidelis]